MGDRRWQVPPGLEVAGSSLLRWPCLVYKSTPTASPLNPEGHGRIRGGGRFPSQAGHRWGFGLRSQ